MKSLSSKTYQCGVTIQGLTTLSGTVYLTGITNTASWDHVIVGTTAQGQIYTRTYAQFMGDVATGISLSSYVTGSGTTNYLSKFTGGSALGNSQIFDNGTSVGIGTNSPVTKLNLKESNTGTEGLIITNWNNVNTLFLGSDSSSGGGKITLKTNAGTSNVFISSYSDSYLNGGNVGIGTNSPREKLQIVGNTVIGSAGLNSYKTNLYLTYNAGSDETWVRIYLPQDYVSSNNGGTVRVRVLWEGDHATFAAYQDYQISYKTFYPSSPYLKFSNVLCTNKTSDFNTGSSYYPASSTPDVLFYDNSDGYLYVKVKGTHTAYNTARYIEAEIFGRTTAQPTIATTSAPGAPVELTKTIQFLPQEGNIYASGSIGIGTTGPSQKLHLYGSGNQLMFIENTATYHMYTGLSSNVGIVGSGNATPLSLQTNGVSRVYLDTGGNVGIGISTPAAKLDVYGGDIYINYNQYLGGGTAYNSVWNRILMYNGSTGDMEITMHNTNWYLRHNANATFAGKVGIGTTNPSNKLDVTVNLDGAQRVAVFKNTYSTGYTSIAIDRPNTARYSFLEHSTAGTTDWYVGTAYNGGGGNSAYQIGTGINTSDSKLFITTGGNVGIGTTNPTNRLQIGSIGSSGYGGNDLAIGNGTQVMAFYQSATVSTWYTNTSFSLMPSGSGSVGNVGIGTLTPSTLLDVSGVITATGGNSTNWNTAYGWGNHASASYVPQARTLTINGTSYDLSANRTWTIATSANIQEAANNGKVTTAASVGTTVITTVATATYDGATFNYVLKDGTNYRAGTIIAVWSAGAVQFNETTTNDIGSTVGVTFAVALNAGNAELRATSATPGWTVKVVTIGI